VRYLCNNRWAAIVGSVVFTYSAYHIATMRGLLQLISLEWFPFFVLFLLLAVNQPAWRSRGDIGRWLLRRALPAGAALLFVSLIDWYYTMYGLMFAGFFAIYLLVRGAFSKPNDGRRAMDDGSLRIGIPGTIVHRPSSMLRSAGEPVARVALCIAVYAVLVSPILVPTLRELGTTTYMQPAPDEAIKNSADLARFFQTPRFQQIWARYFTNWLSWPFAGNSYEVYFTYTALFLAGVGLFAGGRGRPQAIRGRGPTADDGRYVLEDEASHTGSVNPIVHRPSSIGPGPGSRLPGKWFWAACGVLFFLLALGPVLQVNGQQVKGLPMPYNLVERLPLFNISRSPDRFDMPLTLCLGVLAGYGVTALASSWPRSISPATRGALIATGSIILIVVELFPVPFAQAQANIPAWYSILGREPGDFSILDLPPQDDFWHGAFRMYYQTAHDRHIFGGYISREFPHPFLTGTPGYEELTYTDGGGDMFRAGPDQWLSAFDQYRTRYIVLQKERHPGQPERTPDIAPSRDAILHVLGPGARPVYSDSELDAYQVPTPSARVPFLSVGDGWEPRERNERGQTYRWMHGEATLQINAPQRQDAVLSFQAESLGSPRRIQLWHGDHKVFEGTVPAGRQTLKIGPLGLPAGESTIRIVSLDGTTSPAKLGLGNDPRELSIVVLDAYLDQVAESGH
ncbi:MAG: hypothetical protein ACJ78Q_07490, partial [Chloroflexia bacterium]